MKKVLLVLMLILGINSFAGYEAAEFSKKLQTFEETGRVMNNDSDEYVVSTDGKYRVIGVVIEEFNEAVGLRYISFVVQNMKTAKFHLYDLDSDEELDNYIYDGYFKIDYSKLDSKGYVYATGELKQDFRENGMDFLTRYEIKSLIDRYY